MRDCAIGFFKTKQKIGRVVSLGENRTRTCRVPLSYECVNYGVPHKFSTFVRVGIHLGITRFHACPPQRPL